MAKSSKLRVMLSSRCNDRFPLTSGAPLSDIRKELKKELEKFELLGKPLFEVWINEDAPPGAANRDSWEACLEAVRDSDILIVITNGNAGWAADESEIGICHAELMKGLSTSPSKVRLIALPTISPNSKAQGKRDERFQNYLSSQSLFRGGTVTDVDSLKKRVNEAIFDAVLNLAREGVQSDGAGRGYAGEALDWTRLSFVDRAAKMKASLTTFVTGRSGSMATQEGAFVLLADQEVLTIVHAIPAAITVSAAREMVGQPFLSDHKLAKELTNKRGGPIHIIACQKGATEAQAAKFLGFHDAEIVSPPFGVFVADNVQKVQFAFLAGCRDDTTTRHAAQRFFNWLAQTGEDQKLAERAAGRARIVRAIAAEVAG